MLKAKTPKFKKTESWLNELQRTKFVGLFNDIGRLGVRALSEATPRDTGDTATSWSYRIENKGDHIRLVWHNSNVLRNGIPLVVLLHYGHGTGTGGYVPGKNFINPTLDPVYETFLKRLRAEVTYD